MVAIFRVIFQSTLSLRRATRQHCHLPDPPLISIHALLAESDQDTGYAIPERSGISIHALLAESDHPTPAVSSRSFGISIHALLAESDYGRRLTLFCSVQFQSTLSLRRATRSTVRWGDVYSQFQSTLSLRRATQFNIKHCNAVLFQSTLSLRRATGPCHHVGGIVLISIHALLAESDD